MLQELTLEIPPPSHKDYSLALRIMKELVDVGYRVTHMKCPLKERTIILFME